jgi:hypothetical protein
MAALLAISIASCAVPTINQPTDAVAGAVAGTAAHDLVAAASYVCPERRDVGQLSFIIYGITGAVDGLSFEEGFALIDFDTSGLSIVEERRDGDVAMVRLSGTLVETIDPAGYETAYRAGIAARGEPVDQPLLDQVLHLIGDGTYELPVEQTVRVVNRNGLWMVCESPPTP